MALCSNGKVVAWGSPYYGHLDTSSLSNVIAIAAANSHGFALVANGPSSGPPRINSSLIDQFAFDGETVQFEVMAGGTSPLRYQWRFNGTNIKGATNTALVLKNLLPGQEGNYSVLVSNSLGTAISENAYLHLRPLEADIDAPSLTSFPSGSFTFNAAVFGNGPFYFQWFNDQGVLHGETNSSLVLSNIQSNQFGNYWVVVSNAYGCETSMVANLTCNPVIAWGDNRIQQSTLPYGLTDVVALAGGLYHSLALKADGTVTTWGGNAGGALNISPGLTNIVAIAASGYHSLALGSDGKVTAWGNNDDQESSVPDGLNNVVGISSGWAHSLALKANGRVVAWGLNTDGECDVPDNLTNAIAIAAGGQHSFALRSDGTIVAWGSNEGGQLNVPPGLSNVVAIAAGGAYGMALKSDGEVVTWGRNYYGPLKVPDGESNIVAIAADSWHNLAIRNDSTVIGWGDNDLGASNVPPGLTNVVAIACGENHGFALVGPTPSMNKSRLVDRTAVKGGNIYFYLDNVVRLHAAYQWQYNGTNLPGATNRCLALKNVQPDQAGQYSAVITSTAGSETVGPATLTVMAVPQITSTTKLSSDNLQFQVSVEPLGQTQFVVEGSPDLKTWLPVQTNFGVSGTVEIPASIAKQFQFFRIDSRLVRKP